MLALPLRAKAIFRSRSVAGRYLLFSLGFAVSIRISADRRPTHSAPCFKFIRLRKVIFVFHFFAVGHSSHRQLSADAEFERDQRKAMHRKFLIQKCSLPLGCCETFPTDSEINYQRSSKVVISRLITKHFPADSGTVAAAPPSRRRGTGPALQAKGSKIHVDNYIRTNSCEPDAELKLSAKVLLGFLSLARL